MKRKLRGGNASSDDAQPATTGDVRRAVDELARAVKGGFDQHDRRFDQLESDLAGLKQTTVAILQVVESIDGRLRPLQEIPDRVERLEDIVFKTR